MYLYRKTILIKQTGASAWTGILNPDITEAGPAGDI